MTQRIERGSRTSDRRMGTQRGRSRPRPWGELTAKRVLLSMVVVLVGVAILLFLRDRATRAPELPATNLGGAEAGLTRGIGGVSTSSEPVAPASAAGGLGRPRPREPSGLPRCLGARLQLRNSFREYRYLRSFNRGL